MAVAAAETPHADLGGDLLLPCVCPSLPCVRPGALLYCTVLHAASHIIATLSPSLRLWWPPASSTEHARGPTWAGLFGFFRLKHSACRCQFELPHTPASADRTPKACSRTSRVSSVTMCLISGSVCHVCAPALACLIIASAKEAVATEAKAQVHASAQGGWLSPPLSQGSQGDGC